VPVWREPPPPLVEEQETGYEFGPAATYDFEEQYG
jgi:hypothetical protein